MTNRPVAFTAPTCPHDMADWRELYTALSLRDGTPVVYVGRCRLCGPGLVRQVTEHAGERDADMDRAG